MHDVKIVDFAWNMKRTGPQNAYIAKSSLNEFI